MREIIFRGKCNDESTKNIGVWVTGSLLYKDGKAYIVNSDLGECIPVGEGWAQICEVAPETVGQYICNDSNGNRIFENDVVKCEHWYQYNHRGFEKTEPREDIKYAYGYHEKESHIAKSRYYFRNYVVEKYKMFWRIRNKNIIHNLTNSFVFNHNIVVIGNIHDNPELLKT